METINKGDWIKLKTWHELSLIGTVDSDGNITLPNSYRLFKKEADLYGEWYKVKSINDSLIYPEFKQFNCYGKQEVNELEIDMVVTPKDGFYALLECYDIRK